METKIKNVILLATYKMKYLGTNLTKHGQDRCSENYKMLMIEQIKKTPKLIQREIILKNRRPNIVNTSILSPQIDL